MIIPQQYPLWAIHTHSGADVRIEPVIFWAHKDGDLPVAITAECGSVPRGELGRFLSTEAEMVEFKRELDRALREARGDDGPRAVF